MRIEPQHTMARNLLEAAWSINRKVNFMTNKDIETDSLKESLKDVINICNSVIDQIEAEESKGNE